MRTAITFWMAPERRYLTLSITLLVTAVLMVGCNSSYTPPVSIPEGPEYVQRGKELVQGLGACGFCHGDKNTPDSPLSGGMTVYDRYGEVLAPNITPSSNGIGEIKVEELIHSIRSGIAPGGGDLSPDVHDGLQWLSDVDAVAIAAYLYSLPPVDNDVERRILSDYDPQRFFEEGRIQPGFVPPINPKYQVQYGKHLTDNVARCSSCHSGASGFFGVGEYMGGGQLIKRGGSEKYAPALNGSTLDGIGNWSEDQVVYFLQSGETPDGETVDKDFCPIEYYSLSRESDLRAIAKYIKTLD